MITETSHQDIISKTEKNLFQKLLSEQSFWVSVALLGICFVMFFVEDAFSSKDNLFNITRNCHFTKSNTQKLKQVYRKWKTVFPHKSLNDINYPPTSAKALITQLEEELQSEVKNWKLM